MNSKTNFHSDSRNFLATIYTQFILYGIHLWVFRIFIRGYERWLLYILLLIGILTKYALKKGNEHIYQASACLYYAFVLPMVLGLLYICSFIDPIFSLVLTAGGGLFWLELRSKGKRLYISAIPFFVLSIYLVVFYFYSFQLRPTAILSLGILGSLILYAPCRRVLISMPRTTLTISCVSALIAIRMAMFYFCIFPWETDRVMNQEGIHPVFLVEPSDKLGMRAGYKLMFISDACEDGSYFIGPRKTAEHLLYVNTNTTTDVTPLNITLNVSDNIEVDCPANRFFVGAFKHIYKGQIDPPRILAQREISEFNVNWVRADLDRNLLYLSEDTGSHFHIIKDDLASPAVSVILDEDVYMTDVHFDSVGGQFVVGGFTKFGSYIAIYDAGTLEKISRLDLTLDHGFGFLTLDERGRKAYYASFLRGRLYVLDLDRRQITEHVSLQHGLRTAVFDPERDLIYVDGYTRGTLFILDAATLEVVKSVNLGPRIRGLNLSERTGHLFVVSALGGFEIDVDMLVEDNQSRFSPKSGKGSFP